MSDVKLVRDFMPLPMNRKDGAAFRKEFLVPAYENNEKTTIDMNDNKLGYGSSFLEEAFGGLVRETNMRNYDEFRQLYTIKHRHSFYADLVKMYVEEACKEKEKSVGHK